jgi:hypothetical protein
MTLLVGRLRARAWDALSDLSRALLRVRADRLADASLAGGTAGFALAHAYLGPLFPERAHARELQAHMAHALATAEARGAPPWLHAGWSGALWVVEHLSAKDEAGDPGRALDERLLAWLSSDDLPPSYEIVRGLAGIGLFALARMPRRSARAAVVRVVARLDAMTEPRDPGVAFRADAIWNPVANWSPDYAEGDAYFDLGMAHGAAGVVAFLAGAVRAGVGGKRARQLLARTAAWLVAERIARGRGAQFPRYVGDDVRTLDRSRAAWCYGDPGVAMALFHAARALGDAELEATALDVARAATKRSPRDAGVVDASLCHGAAGIAHVFHRLAGATGDATFRRAARRWFAIALDQRVPRGGIAGFRFRAGPRWTSPPGYLTGAAGIALALASATAGVSAAWDAPLGLSLGDAGVS